MSQEWNIKKTFWSDIGAVGHVGMSDQRKIVVGHEQQLVGQWPLTDSYILLYES